MALKNHLSNHQVDENKINAYIKATKMCMATNFCTFKNRYFKTVPGTSMGNPFSPYIPEVFIAKFEID